MNNSFLSFLENFMEASSSRPKLEQIARVHLVVGRPPPCATRILHSLTTLHCAFLDLRIS